MLSANWINPECPYPHSQSTGMALAVCQHSLIINKWITHPYVCGLGGSWGSFRKCEVFMVFLKGLGGRNTLWLWQLWKILWRVT